MSDDKTPKPDPTAGHRRRAPTIELKATEVANEPTAGKAEPESNTPKNEGQPSGEKQEGRSRTGRRLPSWQAFAGAAAGAALIVIGAWLGGHFFEPPSSADLADRIARLETQLRDVAARSAQISDGKLADDIAARLGKIERSLAAPAATDAAVAQQLDAVDGAVKSLAASVATLTQRTEESLALAKDARNRADAAVSHAEAAQKDAAKRESESDADRSMRFAIAALALRDAVERGNPFAAELATVKPLAADPAVLAPVESFAETGVPSNEVLARELSPLIPVMVRALGEPARDGSFLERLQANAARLVRVRPVDEVPGDQPAAIIARLEVKVARADVAGALAELDKLPDTVRAPAADWIGKVKARDAALAASRQIAARALAALAKPAP